MCASKESFEDPSNYTLRAEFFRNLLDSVCEIARLYSFAPLGLNPAPRLTRGSIPRSGPRSLTLVL
jgi:hypothetical protein